MADWSDLVGKTWDEAVQHAHRYNHDIRAQSIDGGACCNNRDYRTDRINVTLVTRNGVRYVDSVRGVG